MAQNQDTPRGPASRGRGAPDPAGMLERLGVHAGRVERPKTEKEAQAIIAAAFRDRRSVLPCGGGTALGAGVLPETVDIALDTTGMDRVLVFDAQNLNVAVLGGMTVDALNSILAAEGRGFCLPLDPPRMDRATIGGVYASNSSGPSRLLYGTVRDQALGVRGVDARGREIGFGGKTVKNVSGYDLTKFFVGSAGSLGLITSVSFRVSPLPDACSVGDVSFETLEQVEGFLSALRSSVLIPSAVVVGAPEGPRAGSRALVVFEGHADAVDRQDRDLVRLAGEHGGTATTSAGRDLLATELRAAVDPVGFGEDHWSFKVTVPIAEGPRSWAELGALSRECGAGRTKTVLYAGNGVITLFVEDVDRDGFRHLVQGAKELADRAGGYATPTRASREMATAWGARTDPKVSRFVLQPLKEGLDPTGVFPPLI